MRITLPALLAEGNYPALAKEFDCEVVILTELALFRTFEGSEAVRHLERYGKVRFVAIDDLLIGSASYGLTLTLAFFRVMSEFGPRMVDIWFLFLNADFILADGSYRTLIPLLKNNVKGVICSPTYCVVEENVISDLKSRRVDGVISIPNREMAGMILGNLHSTVLGQQIDAPFHFDSVYLYQGYIRPNPQLLLGYQMPIAIVAIRPTTHVKKMTTFWDWGGVSEMTPGGSETVLVDSDDFLMLELRTKLTAADLLRIGSPSPEHIAEQLRLSLTRDQIHFGQYPLTLHTADLPNNVEELRQPLTAYYQKMVTLLDRPPVEHRDHPNWLSHEKFYQEQEAVLKGANLGEEARAKFIASSGNSLSTSLMKKYDEALTTMVQREAARFHERIAREFTELMQGYFFSDVEPSSDSYVEFTEKYRDMVLRHHQEWITYEHKFAYLPGIVAAPQVHLQHYERIVLREVEQQTQHEAPQPLQTIVLNDETAAETTRILVSRRRSVRAWLRSKVHRLIGQPPHLTKYHPYAPAFSDIARLLDQYATPQSKVLIVSDETRSSIQRLLTATCTKVDRIPVHVAIDSAVVSNDKFDLCFCGLSFSQLASMNQIFSGVMTALQPGGKVLAFAINEEAAETPSNAQFILDAFAIRAPVKVYYSGSELSMWAIRHYRNAKASFRSPVRAIIALLRSVRLNAMNNSLEAAKTGTATAPRFCASISLEIDIPEIPAKKAIPAQP